MKNTGFTDGKSILSLLNAVADTTLQNRTLYWHNPHYNTTTPVNAVRERNWKLIEYLEQGETELYNLSDDPGENHNLSLPEPDMTANLLRKLHD